GRGAAGVRDRQPGRGGPARGPECDRGRGGGGRSRHRGDRPLARLGRRASRDRRRRSGLAAEPGRRAGVGRAGARGGARAREVPARERGDGLGRRGLAHLARTQARLERPGDRVDHSLARRRRREAGRAGGRPVGGGAVTPGARGDAMSKRIRLAFGAVLSAGALALAMPACESVPLTAAPGTSMSLIANPEFVIANGGTSVVTAILVEPAGTFVPNGTEVFFFTNLGRVDASGKTVNGVARVNFVSD